MKLSFVLVCLSFVVVAGCGGDAPKSVTPAAVSPELAKLALATKPAGAVSVLDARKGGAADSRVVSGRIAVFDLRLELIEGEGLLRCGRWPTKSGPENSARNGSCEDI